MHIRHASAKNCGFLVYPSDSESRSQNQHCRLLVVWNCILCLVIEEVALSASSKTLHVTVMDSAEHLDDSVRNPCACLWASPTEAIPQGWELVDLKKKKEKPTESVPQFSSVTHFHVWYSYEPKSCWIWFCHLVLFSAEWGTSDFHLNWRNQAVHHLLKSKANSRASQK